MKSTDISMQIDKSCSSYDFLPMDINSTMSVLSSFMGVFQGFEADRDNLTFSVNRDINLQIQILYVNKYSCTATYLGR